MSCGCNDSQSSNRDIVVDLNKPHLRTVAVRPTKANPDIRVVVGQGTDGHYEPKEIIYPGYYSPSEIQEKVENYSANNGGCKVCQRYASENDTIKYKHYASIAGGIVVGIVICSVIGYYMTKAKGGAE